MAESTMSAILVDRVNISLLLDPPNQSNDMSMDEFDSAKTLQSSSMAASIFMFSCGVLGNSVALILMATAQPEQRQTMFYKMMAGLVCTDLIGTCATSPVVIMVYVTGREMQEGAILCEYFAFIMVLAGFSTMSVICAMSIERYICICHPYTYQCKMPKTYPKYALATAWLIAAFIASLPLIGLGHNVVKSPKTWCFFDSLSRELPDAIFNYIYVIVGFGILGVTFYCNISTTINVFTQRRRQRELTAQQGQNMRQCRSISQRIAEVHMIVMNFGVTIVFTTCYGPLMMTTLLFRTNLIYHIDTTHVSLLVVRIAAFNQIFDPLVYILVRRDLRWKIISFFKTIFNLGQKDNQVKRNSMGALYNQGSYMYSSNQSMNRICENEADLSFGSFCCKCLCDPPTYSMSRTNRARSVQIPNNLSSANFSESFLSHNLHVKNIIRQPSREEEIELRAVTATNGSMKKSDWV